MTLTAKITALATPSVLNDARGLIHRRDVALRITTSRRLRNICDDSKSIERNEACQIGEMA
jgi:hypothetical protein